MSDNFICWLILIYCFTAVASVYEKDYSRMMYFIGAIILSIGLLMK